MTPSIRRALPLALACLAFAPAVGAQQTERLPPDGVTLVRIEGPLDVGTLSLIRRATEGAIERRDRLLIEMNTPGGEIELMWKLARAIAHASEKGLLTVTWVNDQAFSAGALVAMACDRIYMRSRASIGSATAITIGPTGPMPVSEDAAVREKFNSSFRSQFRGWAEEHGRSGVLAEAMVDADVAVRLVRVDGELRLVSDKEREDLIASGAGFQLVKTVVRKGELLNMTGTEALELQFIDGLAESLDEVLDRMGCRGAVPTVVHRQRSEELAAWLDRLVPLLFIGGLVLAFIEIKMPGFGLPGIGSIACFALLLFGRYLVGLADIPHLVVVAVGVILVAVEIFLVPGTLWAGVLGGLLVIGGLIWANLGPGYGLEYPLDRDLAIDSAFETMLWSAFAAVMMLVISRYLPRTPIMNRLVLDAGGSGAGTSPGDASGAHEIVEALRPGTLGTALTDLRPVGKVQLDGDGREFEASCPGGALESGTRIAVIRIHATGRLEVEAAGAETPGPVGSRSS